MRQYLQQTWQRIQQRIPGTRFNFDFWRNCKPRRSTWPACRAVIAARALDPAAETAMITAIQHAYYRDARNPSDDTTLIALAVDIGLDSAAFARQLADPATQRALDDEMAQARQMGVSGFPSLRLRTANGVWPVTVDYTDTAPMLDAIGMLLAD